MRVLRTWTAGTGIAKRMKDAGCSLEATSCGLSRRWRRNGASAKGNSAIFRTRGNQIMPGNFI